MSLCILCSQFYSESHYAESQTQENTFCQVHIKLATLHFRCTSTLLQDCHDRPTKGLIPFCTLELWKAFNKETESSCDARPWHFPLNFTLKMVTTEPEETTFAFDELKDLLCTLFADRGREVATYSKPITHSAVIYIVFGAYGAYITLRTNSAVLQQIRTALDCFLEIYTFNQLRRNGTACTVWHIWCFAFLLLGGS